MSNNYTLDLAVNSRLEEKYRLDMEDGMCSDALAIATEEFPDLILRLLSSDDQDAYMDTLESLRDKVKDLYFSQNRDKVESDITSELGFTYD